MVDPYHEPAPPPPPRPVRLQLPLSRAWLALTLVAINVALFIVTSVASSGGVLQAIWSGPDTRTLIRFGAKVNDAIVAGEYWRLVTPMFLHIGLLHLLFNQYALAIFGKELETITGSLRFGVIYLLSGLLGTLASFALLPNIAAGASGAIFGIIGAMALFFWRNRAILGPYAHERARSLVVLILINVLLFGQLPGIDNYAHIGGLIGGLLSGWWLTPVYRIEPPPTQTVTDIVPLTADRRPWVAFVVLGVGLLLIALGLMLAIPRAPLLFS